ncbi:MAG: hypothetical protein COV67_03445 [Nitrospinae bacterium CG11_big_fil_rev_8_21_14_0_20_56_8]|nr:MAG: hypothetical protein COV67_03445 [Nitrospinae bacterium CG11_big_fil_rev_8_21_14_0_20_56_8]
MSSSIEQFFQQYLSRFLEGNRAGQYLARVLDECGVGLWPLIDHCTIRTRHVDARAAEILALGYRFDETIGRLDFDSWWAKVFRRPGYPALFIDQAFDGERGKASLIPAWVEAHGDRCFHHLAILVEDIEKSILRFKANGIECVGEIVGGPGSDLRQIFTQPEMREGKVYTVLELIERHNGYMGFLPPQADGLMESTRL